MQSLLKLRLEYIFCLAGIVFILLSMFIIQDITKMQITPRDSIVNPPFYVGICLVAIGILLFSIQHLSLPLSWTALTKIRAGKNSIVVTINHAKVELCFGKIQDSIHSQPKALFALPANDLFDDECITDKRSALGAFINEIFPNRAHEVVNLTRKKLAEKEFDGRVDSSTGTPRYEAGTTIMFCNPLEKEIRMAFVSVTSDKGSEGICCEASYVLRAIKGIHRLMNMKRMDTLVIPLLGSGHGGLMPQLSLLCMLISFTECLREPSGHHLKHVRIVIFQDDKDKKPSISKWRARRLLAFTLRYC
jgi:hypothetical protein